MAEPFDPYYTWLGIPPEEQPPDHYRLLGVRRYETNVDAIVNASDQRMAYIRTFQTGKRTRESQKLLNEVAAAQATLLDSAKKSAYDAQLRSQEIPEAPLMPEGLSATASVLPVAMPLPTTIGDQVILASSDEPTAFPLPAVAPTFAPALSTERKTRRPLSLGKAILIGGGTFAIGLIVLVATLIWAATRS
jgi:hypothetical protein